VDEPTPSLEEIDVVFAALAHEARRHILLILSRLGGELLSGYLASRFGHSWPTTTRHLGVLEKAGLVEVQRKGRSSHYRIKRERVLQVLGFWMENLAPPTPEQKWASTGPKSTHALKKQHRSRVTKSNPKGKSS
jgi:DNA-binding transcriptional ArsR family regulator